MFKLESYITPILLSYVDKYIKNFRPEDSQVSLWGGDASFHNLDLRLDVLEEELQLPFSLVSGHIHELLIHVPWTKLNSEPINITINTIECVLKLRGSENASSDASNVTRENKRKQSRKNEIAAPPGYVQSLINKIVNNITINCNNLILKYVEEDIVVSVNIKLLTFESANENWQATYTELSPTQMVIRKLITLSDLTVCLDKRNAAGKIEVYQEPMLYRCFVEIRLLRNFPSSTAEKAVNTRVDVYCNRMEFSMTEQQIPMLMRMVMLLIALHQRQLKHEVSNESNDAGSGSEEGEVGANSDSWTGWAWSFASTIFPTDDEAIDWSNVQVTSNMAHALQIGVYIDHATFTFKISESYSNIRGYYTTRKLKYCPVLCLRLNGCYTDTMLAGAEWCSVQMGIAEALLLPQGACTCGSPETLDNTLHYLQAGSYTGNHKQDSLFDPERVESRSRRKCFNASWDVYLYTITEDVLLEKTPAFAIDYLYHLEIPEDFTSEKLSELGSDLEYSNLSERSICRMVSGPLTVRVCSGLVHRVSTLQTVMAIYDYPPYKMKPSEPNLCDLHPPSEDDFDALNNYIPTRTYQVTFLKPVIEFQLMDHPNFVPTKGNLSKKRRKISITTQTVNTPILNCPKVTLECETIDIKVIVPVYPKRLIYTTCQLPTPPIQMFNSCYTLATVNAIGLSSQLIFNSSKHTTILVPFNIKCNYKSIIFPKLWVNPDIPHEDVKVEADSITVTGTKAKLMVISHIIDKFSSLDCGDLKTSIFSTSLLSDATKGSGMVVLEICAEQLKYRRVTTISTMTHDIIFGSLKMFVLEPSEVSIVIRETKSLTDLFHHNNCPNNTTQYANEPNQVLIISGPEPNDCGSHISISEEPPLITATLQHPINPEKRVHPPLLVFKTGEIKICFDPLFYRWLLYSPRNVTIKPDMLWNSQIEPMSLRNRTISEASGSLQETPRRANTPHESIHSSSDREHNIHISPPTSRNIEEQMQENNVRNFLYDFMLKWYPVWTNMILHGDIAQCIVFFPTQSLSAIGSQGIQDSVLMSLSRDEPPEIVVVKLPSVAIRSAAQRQSLSNYTSRLPVNLPETIWNSSRESFPLDISIWDLSCYTLQNESKLNFLKPVSGNSTIGLSVKYKANKENIRPVISEGDMKVDKKHVRLSKSLDSLKFSASELSQVSKSSDNLSSLGICIHIDNSPVTIALSEIQVCLMTSILYAFLEVTNKIFSTKIKTDVGIVPVIRKSHSQSLSPTFIKEGTPSSVSEKTPTSPQAEIMEPEDDPNEMKFTAWMQWTIARLRVKLYAHDLENFTSEQFPYLLPPALKFTFDMEDIMSSLDLQQIYMKFKLKIVTANIRHYKRYSPESVWETGPYLGLIMRGREELPPNDRQDDFGFLSLTITRAKCGHVHSKWGTSRKNRLSEAKIENQSVASNTTRYISEVVATLQPIDFVISPKTLKNFYLVLDPLLNMPSRNDPEPKPTVNFMFYINNENLPLAYLDCHGLRVIIPSYELDDKYGFHDVCVIEIESINLTPTAENPICRTPVRPDIYQHAAQSRILNVPGSEVEDRQYQLNVNTLSLNTGSWSEFSQVLSRETSVVSSLHTMNENPALEWNNLGSGRKTLIPHLSLLPIMEKFNLSVVAAPAIVYKGNILVCGNSMEINCVNDVEINVSLRQIRLASALLAEFLVFLDPVHAGTKRPTFTYLYPKYCIPTQVDFTKEEMDQVFIDYTKDSGVEIADMNSEITTKTKDSEKRHVLKLYSDSKSSDRSQTHASKSTNLLSGCNALNYCPVEVLITGGQITCSLYKMDGMGSKYLHKLKKRKSTSSKISSEDIGYEASEEGSVDDSSSSFQQKIQPLLFMLMSQPNIFFSRVAFGRKLHFSCFDICLKANASDYTYTNGIPTQKDYPINLLESKPGIPHPDTGIPPSFLSLRRLKGVGKPPSLELEFGRPIKIVYSLAQWNQLLIIKNRVFETFRDSCGELITSYTITHEKVEKTKERQTEDAIKLGKGNPADTYTKYKAIRTSMWGINCFNLKVSQIVFAFKTESGPELVLSWRKLKSYLTFCNRPERITNVVHLENLTLCANIDNSTKLLLNPWSCTFDVCLFWESWQNMNDDPQMQVSVESECFVLDVGPEQMKCVNAVTKECNELANNYLAYEDAFPEEKPMKAQPEMRDQHYKDDLRAGAFQFVDTSGNPDELPLPYQVVFWNHSFAAMAWRYPQPRILTKVRVFPVPFRINHERAEDQQVLCFLEYWSDCHGCYLPYTQFHLSESEMCHLDLPSNFPQPAVSCTWRVVLSSFGYKPDQSHMFNSKVFVSPRALAACMRIDSYFNPLLVPKMQLAMRLSSFQLCLYNQLNKNMPIVMPDKLSGYTPDGLVPDNQCLLVAAVENSNLYVAFWDFNSAILDFNGSLKCSVLDYAALTMQSFIEPFTLKLSLSLANRLHVSVISEPVNVKFSSTVGHTLAISAQLWEQSWKTKNLVEPPDMVVVTRYVVCNDTNVKLRFGQTGTDEDILLPSRFLHLYCWRSQKYKRHIKIGLEQNGWIWSKPLNIDTNRSEEVDLVSENMTSTLIITVKPLSATQKQIIFSGQLVVCNMLLDHFELKLIPLDSENKEAELRNATSHVLSGNTTAPSFFVNLNQKMALRLRFLSLESAWSGDIPLEENSKCFQPWLVKIPLQERGQFLSIWCRVVCQKQEKNRRVLVMLWPLFMVRSNLPVSTKVHVETPVLNVRLDTTIRGRGELQQLYCPGTIDHSHHLAFELAAETPGSDPYVPLNYSLVDHKEFFKKPNYEDIDVILDCLKNYDKSNWPYISNGLDDSDWIAEEQPLTHVQVRYQNTCQYSSALLVELLPWCLLLNTLGCPLAIIMTGKELCRVSHCGVVTPPKLENTFNIGVGVGETWNISPLLQLARPDWSQSFYMPKINGLIPLEGNIKVPVKCEHTTCVVSITSSVINEIRILQVSSSHVITNHTSLQLQIVCFMLPETCKSYSIPNNLNKFSFSLASNSNKIKAGVPIFSWHPLEDISDSFNEYSLHIMISLDQKIAWSCPIRVDKGLVRKSICLYSDSQNIPLVLIAQEHKGQTFLSLHHDYHPQLLIENKCSTKISCAQYDAINLALIENEQIDWLCSIEADTETYYTMPCVSEKFPEIENNNFEYIVLAVTPEDTANEVCQWSQPVSINNYNEQYIRLPQYGDVKLTIAKLSNTILIIIDSVTEVEISARDIRSRLLLNSSEPTSNLIESQQKPMLKNSDSEIRDDETSFMTAYKDTGSNTTLSSSYMSAEDITTSSLPVNTSPRPKSRHSATCFQSSLSTLTERSNLALLEVPSTVRRHWSDLNIKSSESMIVNTYEEVSPPISKESNLLDLSVFVKSLTFTLTTDSENDSFDHTDIATLTCDNIAFTSFQNDGTDCCFSISEIQCDNQLFHNGNYDFPVLLVGENACGSPNMSSLNAPIAKLIEEAREGAFLIVNLRLESWFDQTTQKTITEIQDVQVAMGPLSSFIEDTYITKLMEHLGDFVPTRLVLWPKYKEPRKFNLNSGLIAIPDQLSWEAGILAKPLILKNLQIEQLSVLLSIHSSMKLYIALDRSPLQFSRFERRNLMTTHYRLGHALTMHYLSGAIFGAGWVVGSLELLGSPSGLARTLGSGLRDFISLPYHGFIQGPWAFLVGITHGSASLMRHITAGTLHSVTKLAASVARNLDRLTLDEEHQQRTEELRRQRPQGLAQGFMQGLTGLGISILGAVGGIAHHPLQSVMNEGASPRGLAAGVGLGLVGVITKPLSGAAELLALTGQGLLQGAGWNTLPEPRINPVLHHKYKSCNNSLLKYKWKFLPNITLQTSLLAVTEAIHVTSGVALILTSEALIVINTDDDVVQRVVSLSEITGVDDTSDPALLRFMLTPPLPPSSQNLDPIEMDPAARARVADYVRNATGLVHLPSRDSSPSHSEIDISPLPSPSSTPMKDPVSQPTLTFYVNPQARNYFCNLLTLAKQQTQDNTFKIL